MEAIVVLVPAPDFKSGGGRGDTSSAGSIPVRFRQTGFGNLSQEPKICWSESGPIGLGAVRSRADAV